MRMDAGHRLLERVDVSALRALVEEVLAPLYDATERPLWATIAERQQWIDRPDRPADIGYRKMRPRGYAQLYLVNDEVPASPWALPLPVDLPRRAELEAEVRAIAGVCQRLFGPGRMHFCVLAILAPGGQIPVHRDMPHAVHRKAFSHHLHLPLFDTPLVHYAFGGDDFTMEAGGVYETNNMAAHSVVNRGETYRVNLMIDYCPEERLSLLDEGEAAHRAAQAEGRAPAASAPEPPRSATIDLASDDGFALHLDLDSVAIKNVVLVPGRAAAEAYLEHLYPLYDGALLIAAEGDYPPSPALRARLLHDLAHDRSLSVFVFGWDALTRVKVATDRLFVADDVLAAPMLRAPFRRTGAIPLDERQLVALMTSFFAQFDKRQILGDHSFYYRNYLDFDQRRFDWRMALLLADPSEEGS